MYFIILVVVLYMRYWLRLNSKPILESLVTTKDVRGFIVFGYVSAIVIGTSIGYTLWFICYCIMNYQNFM